jgi:hypothetical protein
MPSRTALRPGFHPISELISAPLGVFVADVAHGNEATIQPTPVLVPEFCLEYSSDLLLDGRPRDRGL